MILSYAIVTISLCALRAEPSHRSEMVSQLLLGELCTVEEVRKDWIKVRNDADGYEGWLSLSGIEKIPQKTFEAFKQQHSVVVPSPFTAHMSGGADVWVPAGARLYDFNKKADKVDFQIGSKHLTASWQPTYPQNPVEVAMQMLNSPYLWGGKSNAGIDCSGLTQLCFGICGVSLMRDASQQAKMGMPISGVEQAREGDLAFFQNEAGRIMHVGIVLSGHRIIHSSGYVRIDKLDDKGIFRESEGRYSHHLCCIRRMY